jgi:hypothetical protein
MNKISAFLLVKKEFLYLKKLKSNTKNVKKQILEQES